MATNFRAKSAYSPSFVALAFRNQLEYHSFDYKRFSGDDLATLLVNLVRIGPATQEFTRVVGVHLLVDQRCGYFSYVRLAAPLLISSQLCGQ